MSVERLVQERWAHAPVVALEKRLDVLRDMADFRARRINSAGAGVLRREEAEYAALMWAIAELSGVAGEVRAERMQIAEMKAGNINKLRKRAEAAEALNAQYRVKLDVLKAENHSLRMAQKSESQS